VALLTAKDGRGSFWGNGELQNFSNNAKECLKKVFTVSKKKSWRDLSTGGSLFSFLSKMKIFLKN